MLARWFLDVSFNATFLVFAAASLPLIIAHCSKTLGSDRFDGLLVWWFFVVWLLVFVLLNSSAEICAGSLASGCRILGILANIF